MEWRIDLMVLLGTIFGAVAWLTKVELGLKAFRERHDSLQANIDEVDIVASHADNKIKDLELGVEREFVRKSAMAEFRIHFDTQIDKIANRFDRLEALLHDRRRPDL